MIEMSATQQLDMIEQMAERLPGEIAELRDGFHKLDKRLDQRAEDFRKLEAAVSELRAEDDAMLKVASKQRPRADPVPVSKQNDSRPQGMPQRKPVWNWRLGRYV